MWFLLAGYGLAAAAFYVSIYLSAQPDPGEAVLTESPVEAGEVFLRGDAPRAADCPRPFSFTRY